MEENKEIGQNLIYNKRQNLSEENQTNLKANGRN